jgi:hypothetical protein
VALSPGATNNTLGGTAAGAGNLISANNRFGVYLLGGGTSGNVVQGNQIGTDAAGTAALGNTADGVALFSGAIGNTIGGTAAGAGNVISGNGRFGILDADNAAANNVFQANLVGTDRTGSVAIPNAVDGIYLSGASGCQIGGTAAGAGNVISGNGRFGIYLDGPGTSGNAIQGNKVGTAVNGTGAVGNGSSGVFVADGAATNTVGGTVAGAANVIAFNVGTGVVVGSSAADTNTVGNAILRNSIHDNVFLGIDLGNDGTTPNGSGPNGPNHFQNFVVITIATSDGIGGVNLTFMLTSTPNQTYRIEFFVNDTSDPSGFGQGQRFVGATALLVPGSGTASATIHLGDSSTGIFPGQFISATTTDEFGNTSEFSADQIVMGVPKEGERRGVSPP